MNALRITIIVALLAFFAYGVSTWSTERPDVHRTKSVQQIEQM